MRFLFALSANGLLVSAGLAACGGSSSTLGGSRGGDGGSESSSGGGADTGTASIDSGGPEGDSSAADTGTTSSSEAGATDTGTSETGPGTCAPLGAGATDVYVDQRYTGSMHTGVQACPFSTITQGLTAAASLTGTRTVHVAGSSPAVVYMETSSLHVGASIILSGDGPAKTTIQASGACGTATCAVSVGGGGVLQGFTVTCSGGDGIVTTDGMPPAAVRAVMATGSMTDGLLATSNVELGPGFSANANGAGGVESPAGAGGTIHVIGTTNSFDDNMGNGIDVSGSATLNFEGGTASGNFQGIRLAGTAAASLTGHTITSLTATKNTGPGGVVAYGGQTIKLRSSTLTGNTGVGLYYAYVGSSSLDIGANAAGGNTFAGATTANNNGVAGLRLCGVTAASMLTAAGDSWSACLPAQTFADCTNAKPANYADILYGPALAAGMPVAVSGCIVGP